MRTRKPYPSDVSDEEWAFVAPYLALLREDAPQRTHDLREVFDASKVDREERSALADATARLPSVAGRIPADSEVAFHRGFRSDGA